MPRKNCWFNSHRKSDFNSKSRKELNSLDRKVFSTHSVVTKASYGPEANAKLSAHKTLIGSIIASMLSLCGCGRNTSPPAHDEPVLIEQIKVTGFDADGEPIIKKWSDGSLWIHFEAMPPFFAEDNGTESDFGTFELKVQDALGVPVVRDDREVFVIWNPTPDTAEKARSWLENFHKNNGP